MKTMSARKMLRAFSLIEDAVGVETLLSGRWDGRDSRRLERLHILPSNECLCTISAILRRRNGGMLYPVRVCADSLGDPLAKPHDAMLLRGVPFFDIADRTPRTRAIAAPRLP